MSALVDEILNLYQMGDFIQAEEKCLAYIDACKMDFMEQLTLDTATSFAGSVLLLSQICADEKKPWKVIPSLEDASGCIRFLEDYIQDRQMLASTCNSFASAYEYAGFLPEAKKYYQKAVKHGNDPSFVEDAVYSMFLLSLRVEGCVDKNVKKTAAEALDSKMIPDLEREAKEAFSKMLLTDPIEKSDEFLKVRYQVEKLVDAQLSQTKTNDQPFCIAYWDCKKKILQESFQIEWHSPAECNPNIQFQ